MRTYQKAFIGIVLPVLFLLNSFSGFAQRSDDIITEQKKNEIIQKVFTILKDSYIFPEKVPLIQKSIGAKAANGGYGKFFTAESFLKDLNTDLELISNDRHVNVFFDPLVVKQIEASARDTATQASFSTQFLQRANFENFMVRQVERLDGNIGYFKFNQFVDLRISKPTLVAAMNLLSHSSALIIDLRQNGGGHSITTNFLLNYFLPDSTLIGYFNNRLHKTETKIYTEYDPLIRKFANDIPVYILTSKRTSSAAEAFAYSLQAFKRAIIVGDTSNGEANPGYHFAINPEMYMMVPTSINRNAVTKTNWQGIGVIPDVKTGSQNAFMASQALAYEKLANTTRDAGRKYFYEWMAVGFQAQLIPVNPASIDLQNFTGNYADDRSITVDNGNLFYQRKGMSGKKKLLPLTKNLFTLEGASFFRIRFINNNRNSTTALEGMYDDGKIEVSKRID